MTIQSNELRIAISSPIGLQIDNFVYNQHGELHTIRANDFHRFMQPRMSGDYGIYAIPLTPELLEKCGFEIKSGKTKFDNPERGFDWTKGSISILDGQFDIVYDYSGPCTHPDYHQGHEVILLEGGGDYNYAKLNIKYLHQLQNLYYALTNEELPITF
jgi:hypothetical protein